MSDQTVHSRSITLNLAQGLHIRACSRIVALVNGFSGDVTIHNGDRKADAKSMFDLVQLAAPVGTVLLVEVSGQGAEQLLDDLEQLLSAHSEPT